MTKKTLYSATKPTGILHLGNFIGAIKQWKEMQENYNSYFAVADLHSLTIDIDATELRENSYRQLATFLACGLDPEKSTIYMQSHVSGHTQLAWIMECNTMFGEASRMTQFKDAKAKEKSVSVGLFTYPMLMASDIVLFNADVVPVGIDQVQHVEICRDIVERFNSKYGKVLVSPQAIIPKAGAKIMGLLDPLHKMSKSGDNENDVIYLQDSDEVIRSKFKRAVTDSLNQIKYDVTHQPGVSNLLTIYATMKNIGIKQAEEHFAGKNYGALKTETAEAVIEVLSPVRNKLEELLKDRKYLDEVARKGACKANIAAQETVSRAYNAVGLI